MTLKILVVDDFEMMRFQVKRELENLGHTDITEAVDGAQAMEELMNQSGSHPYDLVLCDWNMPKANGMDVLKFCRAIPTYEKTPFVMVTAEAEQEAVVKAINSGATDYIVKPISTEHLQNRLKTILSRLPKVKAA
jgi:two-component system chemotaxis response regulator CheY